ncbi:MAG: hypothetical protein Q9222_000852 [Ikaeria aurantiellina]
MAAFVMQALGCEVAALNTVNYSNHLGYRQSKGTKTSADEISELYAGLKQSYLTDFDVMLSGYAPSAKAVDAVGAIARDLQLRSSTKAGSFFWGVRSPEKAYSRRGIYIDCIRLVLDPVMGDDGRIYVDHDVVPAYRSILANADLILPNQFEAEYVRVSSQAE